VVIYLEQGADLMPLPLTVSCFSKIQIGFTFLVPAHPDSPRQGAVKRVSLGCYKQMFRNSRQSEYCKLTTGRSHLRSANACLLSVPRTRTTYGDRSFAVSGPVAWNSLPVALRSCDVTEETFRRHLKTFLFNSHDNLLCR